MKKLITAISFCLILIPGFAYAQGNAVNFETAANTAKAHFFPNTTNDLVRPLDPSVAATTDEIEPFTVAQQQFSTPKPVTPTPLQPHRIRWSAPGMRKRTLYREHQPPQPGEPVDIRKPTKPFQFSDRLVRKNIKVNRLAPIPFTPFQVRHPATGEPIPPDTLLTLDTLPHRPTLTAQDYYNQLNSLEQGFNNLGYTLDIRRDPGKGLEQAVKLQEMVLDPVIVQRMQQQENLIKSTHILPPGMVSPKTIDELQMEFRQEYQQDTLRLEQLRQYWQQQPFIPETYFTPQQPVPQQPYTPRQQYTPQQQYQQQQQYPPQHQYRPPQQNRLSRRSFNEWLVPSAYATTGDSVHEFKRTFQTPEYEYGYRDLFAVGLHGSAFIKGNGNASHIEAEAEAKAYLFNIPISILRIAGQADASVTEEPERAGLVLTVMGDTTSLVTEKDIIDITRPISKTVSQTFDERWGTSFPLGPILLSVEFGLKAEVGIGFYLKVHPTNLVAQFGPYVAVDVYAQAGVDIIIAEAGVRCTLLLLDDTLTISGELITFLGTSEPYLEATFSIYDKFKALDGHVDVYACIVVPCWDWPPWCDKCWSWEIADWKGLEATGYIVKPETYTLYLISGQSQHEVGEGEERKVEGDIFMTWYPPDFNFIISNSTTHSGPACATFNDRTYVFWNKDQVILYKVMNNLDNTGPNFTGRVEQIPGYTQTWTAPAVCVFKNRLFVFHLSPYGTPGNHGTEIHYRYMDSDGKWWPYGGSVKVELARSNDTPAVCVYKGALYLFFKRHDSRKITYRKAYHLTRNPTGDGSKIIAWQDVPYGAITVQGGTETSHGPAVCYHKNLLWLFHKGRNSRNIYYRSMNKYERWTPKAGSKKVDGSKTDDRPAAVSYDDHIFLIYREGETIYWRANTDKIFEGWEWSQRRLMHGAGATQKPPAACVYKNKLCVFHQWPTHEVEHRKVHFRWGEIQK